MKLGIEKQSTQESSRQARCGWNQ